MVLGAVRTAGVAGVEAELQHARARQPERVPQAVHRRSYYPEVLGHQRQRRPKRARRGVEHGAARAALPVARQRLLRPDGDGPVGDEAAEVVDSRQIEQVECAPQALDPPAITPPPQRRPVVERVAPQLALVGERVGRHARHVTVLEQLGVGAVVGAAGRHVDGDVPHDAHVALGSMASQRAPLAIEAHLVRDGAARRHSLPVRDPVRVPVAEVELLRLRYGRARLGEQPGPGGERRARLVWRPVAVRRPERQHLPPRLPGIRQPVDEGVGLGAQAPAGQ